MPVRLVLILSWVAAVLLGALIPAVIGLIFMGGTRGLPAAFAIAFGHALLLGLPAALLYRAMRWTRLSGAVAGGFLIGAAPAALMLPMTPTHTVSADRGLMIVEGFAFGWLQHFQFLAMLGGLGI